MITPERMQEFHDIAYMYWTGERFADEALEEVVARAREYALSFWHTPIGRWAREIVENPKILEIVLH